MPRHRSACAQRNLPKYSASRRFRYLVLVVPDTRHRRDDRRPMFEEPFQKENAYAETEFDDAVLGAEQGFGADQGFGGDRGFGEEPGPADDPVLAHAAEVIRSWEVPATARRAKVIQAALLGALEYEGIGPELVAPMAVGPLVQALAAVEVELADARRRVEELERVLAARLPGERP